MSPIEVFRDDISADSARDALAAEDSDIMQHIESSKENIEPMRSGRSAAALAKATQPDHVLARRRNAVRRAQFEEEVQTAQEELDDPLEAWCRYISWLHETYPGGNTAESGIARVLERCTEEFANSEEYANDPRYLKIWLQYIQYTDDPVEYYAFMMGKGIGLRSASFYENYAEALHNTGR